MGSGVLVEFDCFLGEVLEEILAEQVGVFDLQVLREVVLELLESEVVAALRNPNCAGGYVLKMM